MKNSTPKPVRKGVLGLWLVAMTALFGLIAVVINSIFDGGVTTSSLPAHQPEIEAMQSAPEISSVAPVASEEQLPPVEEAVTDVVSAEETDEMPKRVEVEITFSPSIPQ